MRAVGARDGCGGVADDGRRGIERWCMAAMLWRRASGICSSTWVRGRALTRSASGSRSWCPMWAIPARRRASGGRRSRRGWRPRSGAVRVPFAAWCGSARGVAAVSRSGDEPGRGTARPRLRPPTPRFFARSTWPSGSATTSPGDVDRHQTGVDVAISRAEVYQAQGMVMARLGVSIEDATVRLRAYAFANDRPLLDVARDIIARVLRLDDDNDDQPPGAEEGP